MAPSAAAKKLEEPVILEKNRTGIRGVLIGPPGSGKGTQVTIHNLLYRNKARKLSSLKPPSMASNYGIHVNYF